MCCSSIRKKTALIFVAPFRFYIYSNYQWLNVDTFYIALIY